jgi:hypothetical protein
MSGQHLFGGSPNKRKSTSMAMRLWPKPRALLAAASTPTTRSTSTEASAIARQIHPGAACGYVDIGFADRLRFPPSSQPVKCLPRPNTHGYHSQQRNDDNDLKRRTRTRATALTAIGADIGSPKRRYQRPARTADTVRAVRSRTARFDPAVPAAPACRPA